ncbi:MAG TPA: hypothetical protein VIN40_08435 [Candidatus Tyrphobacter sp.]
MHRGSEEHKQLFCRTFIDTHERWEPEALTWPELAEKDLAMLRALPIWSTFWQVERNAGVMVDAIAQRESDPLIREALALQGYEESRHGRLIGEIVRQYALPAESQEPDVVATEQAFIDFGCGECVDSFVGFGVFQLARDAAFMPDALFAIFARVLSEEARHIMFFVNWLAYKRAKRPWPLRPLHVASSARGYFHGLRNIVRNGKAAAGGAPSGDLPAGDDVFAGLPLTRVLEACVRENDRRMSAFDPRLLRPSLMPSIGRTALAVARIPARLRGDRRNVKHVEDQYRRAGAERNTGGDL